jgi:hypothetical protein
MECKRFVMIGGSGYATFGRALARPRMHARRQVSQGFSFAATLVGGSLIIAGMPAVAQESPEPPLSLKQEADFDLPAFWMFACLFNHMKFTVARARIMKESRGKPGTYTLSIAPEDDETAVLWRLVVTAKGENVSHVSLHAGPSATEGDQSMAWAVVQSCSSPKNDSLKQEMQRQFQRNLPGPPGSYPAPDMPLDCCHNRSA